jgi:hypothetical protein
VPNASQEFCKQFCFCRAVDVNDKLKLFQTPMSLLLLLIITPLEVAIPEAAG